MKWNQSSRFRIQLHQHKISSAPLPSRPQNLQTMAVNDFNCSLLLCPLLAELEGCPGCVNGQLCLPFSILRIFCERDVTEYAMTFNDQPKPPMNRWIIEQLLQSESFFCNCKNDVGHKCQEKINMFKHLWWFNQYYRCGHNCKDQPTPTIESYGQTGHSHEEITSEASTQLRLANICLLYTKKHTLSSFPIWMGKHCVVNGNISPNRETQMSRNNFPDFTYISHLVSPTGVWYSSLVWALSWSLSSPSLLLVWLCFLAGARTLFYKWCVWTLILLQ